MDIEQFRLNFPEFSDVTRYPDSQIDFWSCIAMAQVNACVWGAMYWKGVQLYTAHEIALAAQNAQTAASGGVPGTGGGIASSKTVGSVSVSYDPNTTTEKDAGWWNLTNYGKQFYRLAMMFGAGAIQL